jgi:DNA-binding transcriptional ArsR family regulator
MEVVTPQVLKFAKATGHPLRIEFLRLLEEVGKLSPKTASLELGWPLGVVAHHVKVLVDADAVVEVERLQRRGAAEHIYVLADYGRLVLDGARFITSPWPRLPQPQGEEVARAPADGRPALNGCSPSST